MRVSLIREVLPPTRGTKGSAGLDLHIPKFTDSYVKAFNIENSSPEYNSFIDPTRKLICIHPHGRVKVPMGIKLEIPKESAVFVKNKGGASWNDRVTKVAQVIDSDYQGEIFVTLINYSNFKTTLQENQKLVQLVRVPVFYDEIEVVPAEQLYVVKSERGEGAMGSTGK